MKHQIKYQSKLTHFAGVLLQALLLVVPISACAATETNQEIGVPQAMKVDASGCFAAVLSPDTDRFYTLREESLTQYQLTQYQINPFKKIGSINIDRAQFKERKHESCRGVWVTNDKTKLIILYDNRIFLLDARTGQLLKDYERPTSADLFHRAILNDDELVTVDSARHINLTIWDVNTLQLKRTFRVGSFSFIADPITWAISKIQNRIYLENAGYLGVLNSKTYAPELEVAKKNMDPRPKISKNYKKLYIPNVSKVLDHLNSTQATYEDVRGDDFLVFDQETRHTSIKNMKDISRDEFDPVLVHRAQLSRNKEFVMVGALFNLMENLNSRMRFRFSQYESGEAILFHGRIGGLLQNFQLTPGARKYLMMKNSEGKIVPINDATFNKYHQPEGKP